MIKKIDGIHSEKVIHRDHLVFAVILVVLTVAAFLFISQKVLKIVENGCFSRLQENAEVASSEFVMNNLHYGGTLQFVADALKDRDDYSTDSLQTKLNDMQPFLRDQKISLLLPGDTVIMPDGVVTASSPMGLSYEEESSLESHVKVKLESDKQEEKLLFHLCLSRVMGVLSLLCSGAFAWRSSTSICVMTSASTVTCLCMSSIAMTAGLLRIRSTIRSRAFVTT